MSKTKEPLTYGAWATAWGPMGAVLGEKGLKSLTLPHYHLDQLLELLAWENPGAVRDESKFENLIALAREYFNGQPVSFDVIGCDVGGSFAAMVYKACRAIPYGQTKSYLYLAEAIGQPDAARAVATALGKNKIPLVIPCHRVTYSDGRLGGFSAPGGVEIKQRMLDLERQGIGNRSRE